MVWCGAGGAGGATGVLVNVPVFTLLSWQLWLFYFLFLFSFFSLFFFPFFFPAIKLHLKDQLRGLSAYMDSMLTKMKTTEDEIVSFTNFLFCFYSFLWRDRLFLTLLLFCSSLVFFLVSFKYNTTNNNINNTNNNNRLVTLSMLKVWQELK